MLAHSEKYNYSLLYSAKCGCTMMRQFFLLLHKDELKEEITTNRFREVEGLFPRPTIHPTHNHFVRDKQIILCRNPYRRVVSLFTDKICGINNSLYSKIEMETITFRNFIYKLIELKKQLNLFRQNTHIVPQSNSTYNKKNDFTTIVKLEEFSEKITKVYTDLGLFRLVPQINSYLDLLKNKKIKINKTKRSNEEVFVYDKEYHTGGIDEFPEYYCFYDEELYEIVYELYKEDFENFGYKKYEI